MFGWLWCDGFVWCFFLLLLFFGWWLLVGCFLPINLFPKAGCCALSLFVLFSLKFFQLLENSFLLLVIKTFLAAK